MPASRRLPAKSSANSGLAIASSSNPKVMAISRDQANSFGAGTGVGITSDHSAPRTSRTALPGSGSAGKARRNVSSNRRFVIRPRRIPYIPFREIGDAAPLAQVHLSHSSAPRVQYAPPFPGAPRPERAMSAEPATTPKFADLGLPETLLHALKDIGYETPSPIQAATIPPLLAGRDVLGTAQTGTGKTAAFALPALTQLDAKATKPQVLVLAPTRELAIQVAEAFQKYAHHIPGFHVLPIYGGQSYHPQLAALKRGVHVVVGTPGRVIDHLDKNTLDLSQLKTLVLDEADEMLRMGFIDDVENILQKTPETR